MADRDFLYNVQYAERPSDSPVWAIVMADAPDTRLLSSEWAVSPNRPEIGLAISTPDMSWLQEEKRKRVYFDFTRAIIDASYQNAYGTWVRDYEPAEGDPMYKSGMALPLTEAAFYANAWFTIDNAGSEMDASFRMRIGWVKSETITEEYSGKDFLNQLNWNNQPEIEWGPYQSYKSSSSQSSFSISPWTADGNLSSLVFAGYSAYPNGTAGYTAAQLKAATKEASRAVAGIARSRILVFEMEGPNSAQIRISAPSLRLRFNKNVKITDFYVKIKQVSNGGTTSQSSGTIQVNRGSQTSIVWDFDSTHEAYTCIQNPSAAPYLAQTTRFLWRVKDTETWTEVAENGFQKEISIAGETFPRGYIDYAIQATLEQYKDALSTKVTNYDSEQRLFDTRPDFWLSVGPKNKFSISDYYDIPSLAHAMATVTFRNREDDAIRLKLYRGNAANPFLDEDFAQDTVALNIGYDWFEDLIGISTAGDTFTIRVVGTNLDGKSSEDSFTVDLSPYITQQPEDQTVIENQEFALTTEAAFGANVFYWYKRTNELVAWESCHASNKQLFVKLTKEQSGTQFRCYPTKEWTESGEGIIVIDAESGEADSADEVRKQKQSQTSIATVTVIPGVNITARLENVTVNEGATVTFSVTAEGPPHSYQWWVKAQNSSTDIALPGETGNTLSFTADYNQNGNRYYCTANDGYNISYSNAATLNVKTQLDITEQPQDTRVPEDTNATFHASAVTSPSRTVRYAWYFYYQSSWRDPSAYGALGTDSETLTIPAVSNFDGSQFRCEVSNGVEVATTNTAVLHVITAPRISQNPQSLTLAEGEDAAFFVAASGEGLRYQWQKTNDGVNWDDIPGETEASLSFQASAETSGTSYRCAIENEAATVYSTPASLTIIAPPTITEQPQDTKVTVGTNTTFHVSARGDNLRYQWQSRNSNDGEWINAAGKTMATITFNAESYQNGWQYRCIVFNNAGSIASDAANLIVYRAAKITQHPVSKSAVVGESVSFHVAATGDNLIYQWQSRKGNGLWTDLPGENSENVSVRADRTSNGTEYRCEVKNDAGSVYSTAASLSVELAKITQQPEDATAVSGNSASFTLIAIGENLAYQWEKKAKDSSDWVPIVGATDAVLTFQAAKDDDSSQYRCTILDNETENLVLAVSMRALLTVIYKPYILVQPQSMSVEVGKKRAFHIEAEGRNLIYQWESYIDNTWTAVGKPISGGETSQSSSDYYVTGDLEYDRQKYRCRVSTEIEELGSVESEIVFLTVVEAPSGSPSDPPVSPVTDDGLLIVIDDGLPIQPRYYKPSEMAPAILDIRRDRQWVKYIEGRMTNLVTGNTGLREHIFQNDSMLTNLFLPSLETIPAYAFNSCSSLQMMYMPACNYISDYAFAACTRLSSISFPLCSGIGYGAFAACTRLSSISFPVCSYIGSSAFSNCTRLSSVYFPVCSYIGSDAFSNCTGLSSISFPVCSYIAYNAFYSCTNLSEASFPVCSYIAYNAFAGCTSLSSVYFPVCSYIGMYAFSNCTSLSIISFPVCSYIAYNAFAGCTSLSSVYFPLCSGIGYGAFAGCTSLSSVYFPVCSYIGSDAFYRCTNLSEALFPLCSYIDTRAFAGCTSLSSISFPVCSYIGTGAFADCTSLSSVYFPECLRIGGYGTAAIGVFEDCTSLKAAIFPKCQIVAFYAFANTKELQFLELPMCIEIGDYAFDGCEKLSCLYLTGNAFCSLKGPASTVFHNTPFLTLGSGSIFIPSGVSWYERYYGDANWYGVRANLVPINET